jgi:NADPH-dependent F420 reductase
MILYLSKLQCALISYLKPGLVAVLGSIIVAGSSSYVLAASHETKETIAIIGTGDMGDSLGPRLAQQGFEVVYGSRSPTDERVQKLVKLTGNGASAETQAVAAQKGDIVILAVPWPAMATVAQNLGDLSGKIIIDLSLPLEQDEDGYMVRTVKTSSAEMIQGWNPNAFVVKAFVTVSSYVIDDPDAFGNAVSIPIAADDKAAKEKVARIITNMGLHPVDAGPLRHSHELEGITILIYVPILQKRTAWELHLPRTNYWACVWEDEWRHPVGNADNLPSIPNTLEMVDYCPESSSE